MYNYGYNPYMMNNNQYGNNFQQPEVLQGCVVDSVDVIKSRNCSMDGSATYYPLSDKSEIYCKQLNPNTGAGMTLRYKLVQPEVEQKISNNDIIPMINNLNNEISELKTLLLESLTSPKGGDK